MNVLFIDTHGNQVNIILESSGKLFERNITSKQNHNEVVMPTIDDVLKNANINVKDINEIIVVNGPGSFTGVRIGVVIAKTLAFCLNIKIKTITSLEMYAVSSSMENCISVVEDAKGFYSAIYEKEECKEFLYQSKNSFKEYTEKIGLPVLQENNIDYYKIKDYLKNKDSLNPHLVNPIYIKEIDVLK